MNWQSRILAVSLEYHQRMIARHHELMNRPSYNRLPQQKRDRLARRLMEHHRRESKRVGALEELEALSAS